MLENQESPKWRTNWKIVGDAPSLRTLQADPAPRGRAHRVLPLQRGNRTGVRLRPGKPRGRWPVPGEGPRLQRVKRQTHRCLTLSRGKGPPPGSVVTGRRPSPPGSALGVPSADWPAVLPRGHLRDSASGRSGLASAPQGAPCLERPEPRRSLPLGAPRSPGHLPAPPLLGLGLLGRRQALRLRQVVHRDGQEDVEQYV